MRFLAIETSCDETSASVLSFDTTITIDSLTTSSSVDMHAISGGIIPEEAAREQLKYIMPVIVEALWKSKYIDDAPYEEKFIASQKILKDSIDAIAVTVGPGLIGSLLVGVETAKTLAYTLNKPIIPVNHLLGHLYANFIQLSTLNSQLSTISFPFIGLIVSGGHTDLLLFTSHNEYKWLGGTRDDAAGEALDKVGRLLGFSYPAGPEIERRAAKVKTPTIAFTSPLIYDKSFEFSFSGLKSEAQRAIKKLGTLSEEQKDHVCYALQKAVFDVLIKKTMKAAVEYSAQSILIGGGVAANQTLIESFKLNAKRLVYPEHDEGLDARIFSPEKILCTDNAAMIGAYALLHNSPEDWKTIIANPELYFSQNIH